MSRSVLNAVLASMVMLSTPSAATVLTLDAGWQDDEIKFAQPASVNSIWSFTIDKAALLSVTDAFIPGDVFTLTGDLSGVTSFFAGLEIDVQNTPDDDYGPAWIDEAYSKIVFLVGPGSYSFSISGGGASGYPTGLGVRLDSSAVPEPASWMLMAFAFGTVGAVVRRGKARVRFAS